jgi:hypothetical protein
LVALIAILAFAFWPIGSVMLCAWIANAHGCKVDEGSVHPCIINGHDYGELLYSFGVMGWLMLVTIPAGLVAFASWLIFLVLHYVTWRKRFAAGIPPPIPPPANSVRVPIAVKGRLLRVERLNAFLALQALACIAVDTQETHAAPAKPAFVFADVGYFHRWSQNDQHEFTPQGQEDLEKWSDMITINAYPTAHDGDALAAKANAVLENYKSHSARVLRTNSVPRTPNRPAEHFIAVVFGRPNFIEVALARFKLMDGVGCSIVYSHRIYGAKVGDQMSEWLKDNGPKTETMLMEWNDIPSPASLRGLPRTKSWTSEINASNSGTNGAARALAGDTSAATESVCSLFEQTMRIHN